MDKDLPSTDVVLVGAGPAGIGMGLALDRLGGLSYIVLEAHRVGESFRRWPAQTRFITPSFYSNPFGLADLNAVDEFSSPAIHAGAEHPSGTQYADYLGFISQGNKLPVLSECPVHSVTISPDGGFVLSTHYGRLHCRFLIWATGEYQFPELSPFPGAHWCPHYAQVTDWADFKAPQYTIIGGFESGVDAAVNLVQLGCHVRLLTRKASWDHKAPYDPSLSLSPHTRQRLHAAIESGQLDIAFGADVAEVSHHAGGGYCIHAADGRHWEASQPPILGNGFLNGGGATQIAELWDWHEDGHVILNDRDESTRTPGLYLVGPQVRHDDLVYCFIYKFRQRFALIAADIAARMTIDAGALKTGDGAWGPFGNSECCVGCAC